MFFEEVLHPQMTYMCTSWKKLRKGRRSLAATRCRTFSLNLSEEVSSSAALLSEHSRPLFPSAELWMWLFQSKGSLCCTGTNGSPQTVSICTLPVPLVWKSMGFWLVPEIRYVVNTSWRAFCSTTLKEIILKRLLTSVLMRLRNDITGVTLCARAVVCL